MPESGSQILSYLGSKELGQGANSNIPVINPNSNLDTINNTARDISLINHENNIKLYDQKIKDRDTTLQMLAQGQIASGEINPNDRPVYEKAKQATSDAFYDWIKNGGLNNPQGFRDYQDKKNELQDVVTHAQSRNLELKKLQQEQSGQTLPDDISMYDNHIKNELSKPFWQPINPLQKAFDLNLPSMTSSILGKSTTEGQLGQLDENGLPTAQTQWTSTTDKNGVITRKQTTKNAPLKSAQLTSTAPAKTGKGNVVTGGTVVNPDGYISPISYTPQKYWDYPTMLKNAQEQFVSDPTQRENQNQWLSHVLAYDEPQKLKLLQAYNARIADYSTERGIQPDKVNPDGTPHYPDQINYTPDQNGKIQIGETPSSFAAKHTLASIEGNYVEKPQPVFNKDIANYDIQKEKAGTDSFYKHAMAGASNTKARAYAANLGQQMKLRKTAAEQDNFLDEIYTRNVIQQPLITGVGNNKINTSNIQASNSLPIFTLDGKTPKQLIPFGAKPVYSPESYKDDGQGNKELKIGSKPTHYEGGYYVPEYLLNGTQLTPQQISDNYSNFKRVAGKGWTGGIEDYIKEAIKNNLFDVKIKGANGATDRGLSAAAQRLISNQGTKKGQTAVFDNEQPPLDDQGVSDQNDTQQ